MKARVKADARDAVVTDDSSEWEEWVPSDLSRKSTLGFPELRRTGSPPRPSLSDSSEPWIQGVARDEATRVGETEADFDSWANAKYFCTLISPKGHQPVEIRNSTNHVLAGSPDGTRWFGEGYFDEDPDAARSWAPRVRLSDECRRQHMYPGVLRASDRGTSLGACLYIGGCVVNRGVPGADNSCTYSIVGDPDFPGVEGRTTDADIAWAGLVKHGLATEIPVGSFDACDEIFLSDHLDAGALAGDYEGYDDAGFDPAYSLACATFEIDGNKIYFHTIATKQLVVHAADVYDGLIEPLPAEAFGQIDFRYTPPELVAEWILWGGLGEGLNRGRTSDGSSPVTLARAIDGSWASTALNAIKDKRLRAEVRNSLEIRTQLELPLQNPGRKRPSRAFKAWMRAYGPRSGW